MNEAKKGDFVKIHNIVLESSQRAPNVPEDTQKVPLEMWVNGFLLSETAETGDCVEIETFAGRRVTGEMVEVNPGFFHTFGQPVKELLRVGIEAKKIIKDYNARNDMP